MENKPIDYLFELSKVLGVENYKGRLIKRNTDGTVECNGVKYASIKEFDFYLENLLKEFSKNWK